MPSGAMCFHYGNEWFFKINKKIQLTEADYNLPLENVLQNPLLYENVNVINFRNKTHQELSLWTIEGSNWDKQLEVWLTCVDSAKFFNPSDRVDYLKKEGYSQRKETALENTNNIRHAYYVKPAVHRLFAYIQETLGIDEKINKYFKEDCVMIKEMINFIQFLFIANNTKPHYRPTIQVTTDRTLSNDYWKIQIKIDKYFDFQIEAKVHNVPHFPCNLPHRSYKKFNYTKYCSHPGTKSIDRMCTKESYLKFTGNSFMEHFSNDTYKRQYNNRFMKIDTQ